MIHPRSLPVGLNSLGAPYMVVNTNVWFVPYHQKMKEIQNHASNIEREKYNETDPDMWNTKEVVASSRRQIRLNIKKLKAC